MKAICLQKCTISEFADVFKPYICTECEPGLGGMCGCFGGLGGRVEEVQQQPEGNVNSVMNL